MRNAGVILVRRQNFTVAQTGGNIKMTGRDEIDCINCFRKG